MSLRLLILICLSVSIAPGSACNREPEPAADTASPSNERPPFEGSLGDFVVVRPTAWVWLDAAAIRADDRIAGFWPASLDDDAVSRAVAQADEVLLVWTGLALTEQVRLLRGDMNRDDVLESLRSGENFAGRPFRPTAVGARKLWRPSESDQAIAVPFDDVLMSGPWEAVQLALSREARATSGPWRDRRFAGHFEAGFHVDPIHVSVASQRISNPQFVDAIRDIRSATAAARLGDNIELRVVFELRRGADPSRLSGILRVVVALGITELGVPDLADQWSVEALTEDPPAITIVGTIPDALIAPLADELLTPAGRRGIPDDWLTPATSPQ